MDLYPYQVEGAKFLAARGRALLADSMGLGKSAQAIRACALVGATSVCVVCPASLRENWRREFAKFWPHGGFDLVVESYDKVARGGFSDWSGDVVVIDEAHFCKTRDSKRTKAIFGEKCDGVGGLVSRAKHVFLLTGTPTPNHPAELWPMLRAVMPEAIDRERWAVPTGSVKRGGLIETPPGADVGACAKVSKPLSYWGFVQKYCRTRDNGFGTQIVGGKNLAQLKERISPYVLRRKKEEVLKDLPPIRFDTLAVEGKLDLNQEQRDATWAVQKVLDEKGVQGLKEIAPHVASLRRVTGLAKVPGCIEWIKDWFEAGGEKLVVFAVHRSVLSALAAGLENASTSKNVRKMDRYSRSAPAERAAGHGVPLRLRANEGSGLSDVAGRAEQELSQVPPEKAWDVSRSGVSALQHCSLASEKSGDSLRFGLERNTSACEVPASRHSTEVEPSTVSPKQSLTRSNSPGEGLHEGQRVGYQLAGQRDQARRDIGRVDGDYTKPEVSSRSLVMVTGATPAGDRQKAVDAFQDDPECRVFIGQIQAAGVGITLTAASDVLFVESSWVPSENEQAAARIHRIGQNNACLVRFAMLAGSIDENIQRAVARKTADIAQLFS